MTQKTSPRPLSRQMRKRRSARRFRGEGFVAPIKLVVAGGGLLGAVPDAPSPIAPVAGELSEIRHVVEDTPALKAPRPESQWGRPLQLRLTLEQARANAADPVFGDLREAVMQAVLDASTTSVPGQLLGTVLTVADVADDTKTPLGRGVVDALRNGSLHTFLPENGLILNPDWLNPDWLTSHDGLETQPMVYPVAAARHPSREAVYAVNRAIGSSAVEKAHVHFIEGNNSFVGRSPIPVVSRQEVEAEADRLRLIARDLPLFGDADGLLEVREAQSLATLFASKSLAKHSSAQQRRRLVEVAAASDHGLEELSDAALAGTVALFAGDAAGIALLPSEGVLRIAAVIIQKDRYAAPLTYQERLVREELDRIFADRGEASLAERTYGMWRSARPSVRDGKEVLPLQQEVERIMGALTRNDIQRIARAFVQQSKDFMDAGSAKGSLSKPTKIAHPA